MLVCARCATRRREIPNSPLRTRRPTRPTKSNCPTVFAESAAPSVRGNHRVARTGSATAVSNGTLSRLEAVAPAAATNGKTRRARVVSNGRGTATGIKSPEFFDGHAANLGPAQPSASRSGFSARRRSAAEHRPRPPKPQSPNVAPAILAAILGANLERSRKLDDLATFVHKTAPRPFCGSSACRPRAVPR
jgi:hypothetical protein